MPPQQATTPIRKIFPFIVALRCLMLLLARQNDSVCCIRSLQGIHVQHSKEVEETPGMRPDLRGPEGYYERGYLDGLAMDPIRGFVDGGYSSAQRTPQPLNESAEAKAGSTNTIRRQIPMQKIQAYSFSLALYMLLAGLDMTLKLESLLRVQNSHSSLTTLSSIWWSDGKSAPETIDAPISSDESSFFCESIFYRCPEECVTIAGCIHSYPMLSRRTRNRRCESVKNS